MSYPNSFTSAVDWVTTVAAALINQLETKVGLNNSTDPNSLDYKIEHLLSSLTGVILPFGAITPPTGFLLCDGAAVSRTTYAALFGIIGTAYGVGNGSTTFNVPDLRQRFPLGKANSGAGSTLGEVGGALSGAHTHTTPEATLITSSGYSHKVLMGEAIGPIILDFAAEGGIRPTVAAGTSGSGGETPPYQVINYIIKY